MKDEKGIRRIYEKYKWLVVAIISYIVFHRFFEGLITSLLGNPLLSTVEPSGVLDAMMYGAVVWLVYRFILRIIKGYIISSSIVIISFIILIAWVIYSYFYSVWDFTSTYYIADINYIYVVPIWVGLNMFLWLLNCIFPNQFTTEEGKGFLPDSPFQGENDDFRREPNAKSIAERIRHTVSADSAFAIGIYGDWGSGKTTFMDFIRKDIEAENKNNKHIIIQFNPWLNNDEQTMIHSFFDTLSLHLKPYNSQLSGEFLRYGSLLLKSVGGESGGKLADLFSTLLPNNPKDLKQRFDDINELLKKVNKQVVVFIDDLDRLYWKELLEVLRLIRNTANFANMVFVTAYDRNYLVSAIRKENRHNAEAYLEKIFQVELPLPAYSRDKLKDKLKELLLRVLNEKHKEQFEGKSNLIDFYFGTREIAIKDTILPPNPVLIHNMRDVYRLYNSFVSSYHQLNVDCDIRDVLKLELLRVKYPEAYVLFAKNYEKYHYIRESDDNRSFVLKEEYYGHQEPSSPIKSKLESDLRSKNPPIKLNDNQVTEVIYILDSLFSHNSINSANPLSISSVYAIDRYFHYKLLDSDIGISQIYELFRTAITNRPTFEKQIQEWIDMKMDDTMNEMFGLVILNYQFSNYDDYKNIFECVFYIIEQQKQSEWSLKKKLVNSFIHICLGKEKVEKVKDYSADKFKIFITQLIGKQNDPLDTIARLIEHTNNHVKSIQTYYKNNNINVEWLCVLSEEDLETYKSKYSATWMNP